jgi:hypothetical protein
VPIESAGNGSFCPVEIIRKYILEYGVHAGPFLSLDGRNRLSAKAISDGVRTIATHAGIEGNFAGHSLRIGGATEYASKGLGLFMIRSIDLWRSDAVYAYLRESMTVGRKLSTLIGFG